MTIKYWLFVIFMNNTQVVGPFDGLIACEKAASQVVIASVEAQRGLRGANTACLSQKHHDFKYKEPKR